MAAPRVTVTPATSKDGPALRRLMQLYCYDFSEFVDMPLGEDGLFGHPAFIEEQFGPNHDTYVIRADGALAGFAIVTPGSHRSGDVNAADVAQFFVLRAWRRQGVGRRAAQRIFDHYPGRWEVRVDDENRPAQAFWREVIQEYTGGDFSEDHVNTERHYGAEFAFQSRESNGDTQPST